MKEVSPHFILYVVAVGLGVSIAWMDSRPNWDDTAITVIMILGVTAILGFANPNRSWIWALSVGVWIPIGNIALYNNYESIPALVLAFIGAFGGAFARRLVSSRP